MFGLRHAVVALAGISILQIVRFSKRHSDRKGPLGAMLKLIAKIPSTAAPLLGAALILVTEQLPPPTKDQAAHELDRLSRRLQVLNAINPTEAAHVMERTKLDVRLKTMGFGELPSSELDIVHDAVRQLSDVADDPDYRDLQAIREELEGAQVGPDEVEELAARRFEVEEAQELYRLLKALNRLAADMDAGRQQGAAGGSDEGREGERADDGGRGLEGEPQA